MITKILAIETSCDETAVAIVQSDRKILVNLVYSQIKEHLAYGGVVPELAARSHLNHLPFLLKQALREASLNFHDLNAIAVTSGPGLMGGILVGVMTAKAIALSTGLPYLAVNHLEGHALTARLTDCVEYPYLLLLASGGHCQFLEIKGLGDYNLLGQTLDDAAGEAFDKVAKLLDLPGGGPNVEKMAKMGKEDQYLLPIPLHGRAGCDMSFSGLKTAVRELVYKTSPLTDEIKQDIAASFQKTVGKMLVKKTKAALAMAPHQILVFAGGVAANQYLRNVLQQLCDDYGIRFVVPSVSLCTDNAAMIGWAAMEHFQRGNYQNLDFQPRPRWPLT